MTNGLPPVDPGFFPPGIIAPIPAGGPTFDGFATWVVTVMKVPANAMPDDYILRLAYDTAVNLAYIGLATVPSQSTSPSLYAVAVYNLGGAFLVQFAQDTPPSTFWTDLRTQLNINSPSFGIITGAHDQGTGDVLYIPEAIKNMTLLDLQLMKSPWGQMYLMLAGEWGALWGFTA